MKIKTKLKAGAGTCTNEAYEDKLATCKNADGGYDALCVDEVYDSCSM